jgi:hypothetical protein
MEKHSDKDTAHRGVRKSVTLLLLGDDESAVVHPMYLHATKSGFVHGIAISKDRHATHFAIPLNEFHKTQLNVVKGNV